MSRVGKAPIALPKGAEVSFAGGLLTVKGPLGTLTQLIHDLVKVVIDNGTITFSPANDSREANALQGTMRALVANMVKGVTTGFERKLTLVGVGYRAALQGTALKLQLGFSHDVIHEMPAGVKAETPTQTESSSRVRTSRKLVRSPLKCVAIVRLSRIRARACAMPMSA